MQLSSKARKAVALGLAVSTLLWSAVIVITPFASAAVHNDGCIVLSGGTVWLITGGTRRGFTSAEVFASSGYNFGQVVSATAEDVALPVGPIMTYADGTLVMGPGDPLVYLVANGQKRGFTTASVLQGLGYSFSNVQVAPANTFADLPTGANIDSTTIAHPAGTLVNSGGTLFQMTATGKKGIPSMDVFNSYGLNLSHAVATNSLDLSATDEGVLTQRILSCGSGTPTSGPVNVSLASDTPVSGTLVAGQIAADLAHFTFTGSGKVTGVTFKRIGVSDDATLVNVYLYNGDTRLTDAASISSGSLVNFSNGNGLFTVSGSLTLAVKADIKSSVSGQTIGVQFVSGTTDNGVVGGSGSGNLMSVASASNLATADLSSPTPSGSPTTDPTTELVVWQSSLTVNNHDVNFVRFALREIGSINAGDIGNFKLLVDGVQVASVSTLDTNSYATFSVVPNKLLTSGVHTIKVLADVTGGSSRTFAFSLRNKADIGLVDTSFNVEVGVTSSTTIPATAGQFTVSGSSSTNNNVTVQKMTDSPSSDVTSNGKDVVLARFAVTSYGEAVKVDALKFKATMTTNAHTATSLRNGRVMIGTGSALSQYGSTASFVIADTSYTVNYTFPVGTATTVEFRADMYADAATTTGALANNDTIKVSMDTGATGNGQGIVSMNTITVPASAVAANTVTVKTGTIVGSANTNYGNQTTTVPQIAYKIGSFNVTGASTEDVNIDTISILFTAHAKATFSLATLNNVYVTWGGVREPQTKATVGTASDDSATAAWSVSHVLAKNVVVPVEIFADISSTPTASYIYLTPTISGTTVASGIAASTGAISGGQHIIIGTGTIATSLSLATPDPKIVNSNTTQTVAAFRFQTNYDNYTITDVTVSVAAGTTVQNVILKDNTGTVLGTKPVGASNQAIFTGLSYPVNNTTKDLTVDLQLGSVGSGAGTSGEDVKVSLIDYKATNSTGSITGTVSDVNSGSFPFAAKDTYVFKAIPTISNNAMTDPLAVGTNAPIYRFSINSGGTGTISWKDLVFVVTSNKSTTTIADGSHATLWNADTNAQIQGTATVSGLSSGHATGAITFVANTEHEITGAVNYVLKADVGGTPTVSGGDSLSTNLAASASDITNGQTLGSANTASAVYNSGSGTSIVWSDESAQSHAVGTYDWYSDYLVKNLPTTSENIHP